jgi:LacI family transcriptional regulator
VAEAMVELGHRRIAIITGPENTTTSRDRERGFREELEAFGVQFDETLRRVGQFSHHSGYQWCLDLLAAEARPTAVFAANDVIAFGALDAARRVGVRVPSELSIVGFDDIDMAGWDGFNLTTVRQPLEEMGRAAAQLLIDRIVSEGETPPRRRVFPVGLVRRETLAPAPGA